MRYGQSGRDIEHSVDIGTRCNTAINYTLMPTRANIFLINRPGFDIGLIKDEVAGILVNGTEVGFTIRTREESRSCSPIGITDLLDRRHLPELFDLHGIPVQRDD